MIKLEKKCGRDFRILNLTDPQLCGKEWAPDEPAAKILKYTAEELISRIHPDLITVSGDFSYSGDFESYENYGEYFDKFGIPWTCCFGNHDNQGGPEFISEVVAGFRKHPLFLYEECDTSLGNCNHVIAINESGKTVEGVIMMDTHDRLPYKNENGEEKLVWAKLSNEQLKWYREKISELEKAGCRDTTLITHIPIYAFNDAKKAALRSDIDPKAVSLQESACADIWNDGYKDSFGVFYEGIGSYPEDDGMFDLINELGSTKTVVCGHDHVNNSVIRYHGVRFVYGLKLGMGCYWDPRLNGGTVLTVTSGGVSDVRHEYVDIAHFLQT